MLDTVLQKCSENTRQVEWNDQSADGLLESECGKRRGHWLVNVQKPMFRAERCPSKLRVAVVKGIEAVGHE